MRRPHWKHYWSFLRTRKGRKLHHLICVCRGKAFRYHILGKAPRGHAG